jgi:hypothetical protein
VNRDRHLRVRGAEAGHWRKPVGGACNVTGNVRVRVLPVKALQAVQATVRGVRVHAPKGESTNASGDGLATLPSGENPRYRPGSSQRELAGPRYEAHTKANVEVQMQWASRTREAVTQ